MQDPPEFHPVLHNELHRWAEVFRGKLSGFQSTSESVVRHFVPTISLVVVLVVKEFGQVSMLLSPFLITNTRDKFWQSF